MFRNRFVGPVGTSSIFLRSDLKREAEARDQQMSELCVITGGAGFIGQHLCRELLSAGYSVRILDGFDAQVHGDASGRSPVGDAELVRGDIRDRRAVRQAVDGADVVVHLAAQVGVGQSMYEIEEYVGTNDLGTAVLLEVLIGRPVRKLVVASSMSVYGEGRYTDASGRSVDAGQRSALDLAAGRWEPKGADGEPLRPQPTDETKPVDLASIYALTKYFQERAVLLFGAAYGIDAVALRLFNVFGPGQALSNPYTGVLANFASRLAADAPPTIFEDGQQRRDFVHVRDVARAFRLAIESPGVSGEVINVGCGRSYSILDVAELLASAMGKRIQPEVLGKARSGDIRHCFADIGKARALLGFAPELALGDAVGEFAEWVARQTYRDRGPEMRRQLEARGLVS
jgi:dTDP-L-rhamnose 4-epimerase